jgi:hypothetical protein
MLAARSFGNPKTGRVISWRNKHLPQVRSWLADWNAIFKGMCESFDLVGRIAAARGGL